MRNLSFFTSGRYGQTIPANRGVASSLAVVFDVHLVPKEAKKLPSPLVFDQTV